MRLGFTGTRNLLPLVQAQALDREVIDLQPSEGHSGDCVGADHAFHQVCVAHGIKTIGHVPLSDELRAHCAYDEERLPKGYFARNRAIVNEADRLLACPRLNQREDSGGTWYTIDYALNIRKPVTVIWPDGRVERDWTCG